MNPFLKFTIALCVVVALSSQNVVDLASRIEWRMWVYPPVVALLFAITMIRARARYCAMRV